MNIPIFNIKVASELVKQGFIITDLQPNKYHKNKTVCFFKYNCDLKDILKNDYQIIIDSKNIGGGKHIENKNRFNKVSATS